MISVSSQMLNELDNLQEWISSSLALVEKMNPTMQATHHFHC